MTSLTPGAIDALRMVIARGRAFTAQDDSGSAPVALINETMARRYWPDENPIGRAIKMGFYSAPIERQIVGVVADRIDLARHAHGHRAGGARARRQAHRGRARSTDSDRGDSSVR